MTKTVYVLNGPNLNLLGTREPHIYGSTTLAEIEARLRSQCESQNVNLTFLQSNHEGQLIDWVQEAASKASTLIINPAGYGHTSVALLDSLKALTIPVIECHLSNPQRREPFRHHSYVSHAASGIIAGFGAKSYEMALDAALSLIDSAPKSA